MDKYPYKKKPKKKVENIIFWAIVVFLFLYMLFRTEIISETKNCSGCVNPEMCENVCIRFCLTRLTDIITTTGYENNSVIYCNCKCNSNLHVLVDRFL